MQNRLKFTSFLSKALILLLFFLSFQIAIGSLISYKFSIEKINKDLEKRINRIREDIAFQKDKWNLSLYNADSKLLDDGPLYIIASDGLIIERSRPISGLLDPSRYSPLLAYSSPTTIETATSENWRMFSNPLQSNGQTVGVVLTAFYSPKEENLQDTDKQLKSTMSTILSNISISGDSIDTSKLEIRSLPYNISFMIVNRFNKVLIQSNNSNSVTRMPTNIDRSYVDNQLKGNKEEIVEDDLTHKKYLIMTAPVYDENKLVAGIIVAGASIDYVYSSIRIYVVALFFSGLLLLFIFLPLVRYYIDKIQKNKLATKEEKQIPKTILFMKKSCKLNLDEEQIDIPYASFQYYFCNSLFSKPQKKWEVDELLEAFGEEDFGPDKWRKVYDTMVALNRKTSHAVDKLFMVKNKRYTINPQFIPLIKASDT